MEDKKIAKISLLAMMVIFFIVTVSCLAYACFVEKNVIIFVIFFLSSILTYGIGYALYKTGNLPWTNWFKKFFDKNKKRKEEGVMIRESVLERFKLPQNIVLQTLDIIDNLIGKSQKGGLVLSEKDMILEKLFFLCVLEQWMGGIGKKRIIGAEEAEQDLNQRIEIFFKPFKLEANIKDEKKQGQNQQKYTVHLETVKKEIINLLLLYK
jgi:hypothetical protein